MVFDSIYFHYKNLDLLRGVYLKVNQKSITGLYGLNGSGKTTLLKIGAGLLLQTDGIILIENKVYSKRELNKRYKYIGYLSQESFLPQDLTFIEFMRLSSTKIPELQNDEFIEKIGRTKICNLSSGEKRLLEISFIFSLNRQYYLLDEPFTGIEPLIIEKISNKILEQKYKGSGVLITDHYYQYINPITDFSYILKDGQCKLISPNRSIKDELNKYW